MTKNWSRLQLELSRDQIFVTSEQVRQSCLNEQHLYFAAKREMCQVCADYMKAKIAAAEKTNANPDPSEIPDDIEI